MLSRAFDPVAHPRASARLRVLRDRDVQALEGLLQCLPELEERFAEDEALAGLADLLITLADEAPDCGPELIARLSQLAGDVDVAALRRWAYFGMQRHRFDAAERLRYFASTDPIAFVRREDAVDDGRWTARRAELMHYLAGFGHAGVRIERQDPVRHNGVPQRASLAADLLLLPFRLDAPSPSVREMSYRATAAHAVAHLEFSPRMRPAGNRAPMTLAMMGLIEDARVERLMMRRYPGLRELWGCFHVATRASAEFGFAGLCARLARALHDSAYADGNAWVERGRELFEAAGAELADHQPFERIGRQLAADIEAMRIPFIAPRYRVEPAYRDDNSFLWRGSQPLPEDDSRTVVHEKFDIRDDVPPDLPSSLRRAEVDARRLTRYPEWDCRSESIHERWTTVVDCYGGEGTPAGRRGVPPAARRNVPWKTRDRIPDRAIRSRRLEEGDELDLDAAVLGVVARRSAAPPDPRIFRRHGWRRGSVAIVILLDFSESTSHFVPGSFIKVLDAEKQAAGQLMDCLDAGRDRIAVHGFASNGRHEVRYVHVKDFDEPFGAEQVERMAALESALSTRMGAALRHATACLELEPAGQRLIVLLTDGEPSDVDVLEDDYLREDARHAVTSAMARGIRTFCFTLDRRADPYVRRIFGERNYLIAEHADVLTRNAQRVLARLMSH